MATVAPDPQLPAGVLQTCRFERATSADRARSRDAGAPGPRSSGLCPSTSATDVIDSPATGGVEIRHRHSRRAMDTQSAGRHRRIQRNFSQRSGRSRRSALKVVLTPIAPLNVALEDRNCRESGHSRRVQGDGGWCDFGRSLLQSFANASHRRIVSCVPHRPAWPFASSSHVRIEAADGHGTTVTWCLAR